jgi:hypothetical protein
MSGSPDGDKKEIQSSHPTRRDFVKGSSIAGVAGLAGLFLGASLPRTPATESTTISKTLTQWSNIQRKPFVLITPNGPDDGGDFGPNTPDTTTDGIQEAVNEASDGSIVVMLPFDASQTGNITLNKNLSLIGFRNPRTSDETPTSAVLPQIAGLTIDSTNEQLSGIYIQGISMESLLINANNNSCHATTLDQCRVEQGIVIQGNALADYTTFHACELRNLNGTILFDITNTSNGEYGGVNQLFIDGGSLLDVEAPSGGHAYFFKLNSQSQTYPIITGCSLIVKATATDCAFFKCIDFYGLNAMILNCQTEFHCPVTGIIEVLDSTQTRPYNLNMNWDSFLGSYNSSGSNHLLNITSEKYTPTIFSSLRIRAEDAQETASFDLGILSCPLAIDVKVLSNGDYGFGIVTPDIPAGVGQSNLVTNVHPFPVGIFQGGSSGTKMIDATRTGFSGLLPSEPTFFVLPSGWSVFYVNSPPASWKWVMLAI